MAERKWNESKAQFENYCNEQLKSIKVAIERKANGSVVEDGYFMEHLEKLKRFFLETEVWKPEPRCEGKCEDCPAIGLGC